MIKPLTSLRFFFAIMVFVSHLTFLEKSNSSFLSITYKSVFTEGYIGVSFFFILSGFILAYNYQDKFLKKKQSIRTFYKARVARIYPLYLLTFIVSMPLTYHVFLQNKSLWLSQAVTNLTLTQSYIPLHEYIFSFNRPAWSISNEMFFYLTFPFLILLIPAIKYKKHLMLIIIFSIPALALIIAEDYHHQILYIHPFIRITDFIIGIFIFNIYIRYSNPDKILNYSLLEILAILLLLIFFIFHPWIPQVARFSYYYWLPMSFLIFSFSFQKGKVSNFLSGKILNHLGEISFAFYMFHQLVLRYFQIINLKFLHIENEIFIIITTFTISLIISHFTFIWFETPMNKYLRNILNKRSTIREKTSEVN